MASWLGHVQAGGGFSPVTGLSALVSSLSNNRITAEALEGLLHVQYSHAHEPHSQRSCELKRGEGSSVDAFCVCLGGYALRIYVGENGLSREAGYELPRPSP